MLYKTTLFRLGLIAVLLSALLASCMSNSEKSETENTNANTEASKLPVDVILAEEHPLVQEEVVVGTMISNREVAIVGELPQKITHIAFKDGGTVKQGDLLYRLNDADIRSRLKQVDAELELARLTKVRMANLLKTETIRQQEYDEVLMRYRSLEAQKELLVVELDKTFIKAPFTGKIGISKVHVGAYISPGEELVMLQDLSSIKIHFSIAEKYAGLVQVGNKVRFVTELSDLAFLADIKAIEPGLDVQGRSLQIQAIASNVNEQFKAGLSARVYVSVVNNGAKGILIPSQAVVPTSNGYTVFVIHKGVAKSVGVEINNRTEQDVIITSGITAGDQVIVSNILRLADGVAVEAIASN